jgi:hypothetical protein
VAIKDTFYDIGINYVKGLFTKPEMKFSHAAKEATLEYIQEERQFMKYLCVTTYITATAAAVDLGQAIFTHAPAPSLLPYIGPWTGAGIDMLILAASGAGCAFGWANRAKLAVAERIVSRIDPDQVEELVRTTGKDLRSTLQQYAR